MPGGSRSRSRITVEQRRLMLEFIKDNPAIAIGRFEGANGAKLRSNLLNEMANILNSQGSGATKTSEKWLRSWQDWKSDTKRKAAVIARQAQDTGDRIACTALSELEKELVDLIGSISGLKAPEPVVLDTRKNQEMLETKPQDPHKKPQLVQVVPKLELSEDITTDDIKEHNINRKKRKIHGDLIDSRIVSAIEHQAEANAEVARQIGRLVEVGVMFLKAWAKFNNVDIEDLNKPFIDE